GSPTRGRQSRIGRGEEVQQNSIGDGERGFKRRDGRVCGNGLNRIGDGLNESSIVAPSTERVGRRAILRRLDVIRRGLAGKRRISDEYENVTTATRPVESGSLLVHLAVHNKPGAGWHRRNRGG